MMRESRAEEGSFDASVFVWDAVCENTHLRCDFPDNTKVQSR